MDSPPHAPRGGAGVLRLALPLLALCSGCMAGLPPMRADLGAGGVVMPHGTGTNTEGIGSFRAALFPAQVVRSLEGRRIDVGAGYGYDEGGGFETHTAFAEVDALRRLGVGRRSPVLGFGLAPRLVWDGMRDHAGGGVGLRVSLDFAHTFVDEYDFNNTDAAIFGEGAYGQATFGVYSETTFTALGPYRFGTVTLGLSFRLPTMGFIAL